MLFTDGDAHTDEGHAGCRELGWNGCTGDLGEVTAAAMNPV